MKKIILIIIDGLGDESIPQLKNQTPLQVAKTPNLDFLAKNGSCGLILPWVRQGKFPTSEDTHLALFGFEPEIYNPGRGVLEALGIEMKILPKDVCLRGNFASVDPETLKIIDRRAGRIKETKSLIKSISNLQIEGVKFLIGKAISHRVVIVMRGKNLSSKISDGDPKIIGVTPQKILALDKSHQAKFTAQVLNQFLEKTYLILKEHPLNKKRKKQGKLPANYLLVRGAGVFKEIESFEKKYHQKAACIAGGTLYRGIGKYLGMKIIKVKGANGLVTTNLKGKVLAAKKALSKYDFVFLHIKAADNLAEDGNFVGKIKFIEKIDKNLKFLLGLKNTLIVVTGDHSTCSLLKRHCLAPIPILIFGSEKDKIERFNERACQKGKLGKIKQLNLMSTIFTLAQN